MKSSSAARNTRVPKTVGYRLAAATVLLTLIAFATACPGPPPPPPPLNPQDLPPDAINSCPLNTPLATWFQSGSVSLNGVVNPANSLVALTPNCGFYQWGQQMFLWLTSPAPPTYGGGGGLIVNSPAFYDVSPPDANGNRSFIAHAPGRISIFPLRAAQVGPHGLPVIMEETGVMLEVQPNPPHAKPLIKDETGKTIEIVHVRPSDGGRPILLDRAGKIIPPQRAHFPARTERKQAASNALMVHKFVIDGIPIFIDPTLAVVTVEQGQAQDQGVLEAQQSANGSLVYYATMVNDVYAYFATAVKNQVPPLASATEFPTSSTDLTNVINFATSQGKTSSPLSDPCSVTTSPFPDPCALAVEVKSSWVVAAGLPNLSSYITMNATIPTYNPAPPPPSGTATMNTTGQQTVQLALVGMHIVGSTLGHPEMVWATFEHLANAPRAAYSYTNTSNATINVPQNAAANWVFSANGSSGPFNVPLMAFNGPPANQITANTSAGIGPSNTSRQFPFGIDPTNASSNSQVISTNNNVRGALASGDLRANYILTGATWIANGGPPDGGTQVGTNTMTNATMETYQQGSNCFDCHTNSNAAGSMLGLLVNKQGQGLSHIYGGLAPLPKN